MGLDRSMIWGIGVLIECSNLGIIGKICWKNELKGILWLFAEGWLVAIVEN